MLSYIFVPAALLAAAATTPPDVTLIRDEPFAANGSAIYVLRSVHDNLGSHYTKESETFLVRISIDDGTERHWPLIWSQQSFDGKMTITVRRNEGADGRPVDPFSIIAADGAAPFAAVNGSFEEPYQEAMLEDDRVVIPGFRNVEFVFSQNDMVQRVTRSARALAPMIAPKARGGPSPEFNFYAEREVDSRTCRYDEVGHDYGVGTNQVSVIRITCHDRDELHYTSLLVPIRASEPPHADD